MFRQLSVTLGPLLVLMQIASAQNIVPNSCFGTLAPFNERAYYHSAEPFLAITYNQLTHLNKAYTAKMVIQHKYFLASMQQTKWEEGLSKTKLISIVPIPLGAHLQIQPILTFSHYNLPNHTHLNEFEGGLGFKYEMTKQWRLASQILFKNQPGEKAIYQWFTGIQYQASTFLQVELNIKREVYTQQIKSLVLLKWNAHKRFSSSLGLQSEGTWLWQNDMLYRKTKISTLVIADPILGISYHIACSIPLTLRPSI